MKLSTYFTLEEMIESQMATRRGIDNTPPDSAITALENLCRNLLDPIRELAGAPVFVSSGYRSPKINMLIGGTARSQHLLGEAADIKAAGVSAERLFELIRHSSLPFDQLIFEGTWNHVSYSAKGANRGEVLIATFKNGRAIYRHVAR